MKRIWSFRSTSNFVITVFGVSSLGLYAYSIYKQEMFSNPMISESVRILSQNQKLKQMLGYPLSYQAAMSNTRIDKDNQIYYSFKVVGPRANVEVQMNTSAIQIGQTNLKQLQLAKDISGLGVQINDLKQQIEEQKDRQKKSVLSADLKVKQSQLQTKKNRLKEQKTSIEQKIYKYYIPEQDLYESIIGKKSHEELPHDTRLWGIDNLVVQLPNRTKMVILDEKLKQQQLTIAHIKKEHKPFTSSYIRSRITSQVKLNEDELEQYSKHKTNFMYSKYGSYRLAMMVCAVIGVSLAFVVFSKNRYTSVANSGLLYSAEKAFLRNQNIINLMQQKNILMLKWNQKLIGGGKKGNNFDCTIDVEGIPGGKVYMSGRYAQKQQEYQFETFDFSFKDVDNKIVKIDLKKPQPKLRFKSK